MAQLLQVLEGSLFADKLLEDLREPLTTFAIPGFDGAFGLFAPTLTIWQQLLYVRKPSFCGFVHHSCTLHHSLVRSRTTPTYAPTT
jgi:hypothetical protein